MMRTPLQLIDELNLSAALKVEELAQRRRAFDSVHLGMQALPAGTLFNLLRDESALKPPRTGHLGNWQDIALGRAGPMDFNKAICGRGFGYPLIYCFTQTEAEGSTNGDWVYLPGSLAQRGTREALPLFTWDGTAFVRRSREQPLFCPFVQTEVDGALLPLIELHGQRMATITQFDFTFEAEVMVKHAAEVRVMLALLLEEARQCDNPRSFFQDLISHAVAKDGTVTRCQVRHDGQGYWLDDCYYPTTEALVEHTLLLFQAVTEPRAFLANMAALPPLLPVMSNVVARIFSILFMSHYPEIGAARPELSTPFNLHFHWGARDMAGFPPRQKGYFVTRSKTRSFRIICETLLAHLPKVAPICVALLPASIFMLWPASAYPRDAELLADLFRQVQRASDSQRPDQLQQTVEQVTQRWLARHESDLSSYFLNRFQPRRGVLHAGELPESSEPQEPDGFRALTLQQTCMIVGALVEMLQSEVAV